MDNETEASTGYSGLRYMNGIVENLLHKKLENESAEFKVVWRIEM